MPHVAPKPDIDASTSRLAGRRIWLLANPRAGRGYGRAVAEAIKHDLRVAGCSVSTSFDPPPDACAPERPEAVIVVGGDGTLRAAVQRVLSCYDDGAEPLPAILPVPMGTANLVGQYLGLERGLLDMGLEGMRSLAATMAPETALRRLPRLRLGTMRLSGPWLARKMLRRLLPPAAEVARQQAGLVGQALNRWELHHLDVGSANGQVFLLMAGIGFDAHVVHALDRRRGGPIGLLSYALPAASAVARYGFPPIRVDVDGQRVFGPRQAVVMIANLPQYGTGFPIIPQARGDDRRLDVLCLPCSSRAKLAKIIALAADRRHLNLTGAVSAAGQRVRVTSEVPVPVQIDGDPGGTLPLEAGLLERQVPFLKLYRPASQ